MLIPYPYQYRDKTIRKKANIKKQAEPKITSNKYSSLYNRKKIIH